MAASPSLIGVVVLGALSGLGYGVLALRVNSDGSLRAVSIFLALMAGLFVLHALALAPARRALARNRRRALVVIFGFAALFRFLMLFAGLPVGPGRGSSIEALGDDLGGDTPAYETFLLYDNDVWRYLWDGHVAAVGLDPYEWRPRDLEALGEEGHAPAGVFEPTAEGASESFWWEVFENLSFTDYRTVYPPLAMAFFWSAHQLAPGSVFILKLLIALADLATCWFLLRLLIRIGRGSELVLLYAWNPLVVKEFAGSGHVDALMILLLVVAIERSLAGFERSSSGAFGASVAAKLGSLPLAPWLLSRSLGGTGFRAWWPALVVPLGFTLPFLSGMDRMFESLGAFGRGWVFNAGPWNLIRWLAEGVGLNAPESWAHGLLKGLAVVVALVLGWRARDLAPRIWLHAGFLILAIAILTQAAVMPWYLLWALPLAVACGLRSWTVLTALSLLSYLVYALQAEQAWWLWLEYGGFAIVLAFEWTRNPELRRAWRQLAAPSRP